MSRRPGGKGGGKGDGKAGGRGAGTGQRTGNRQLTVRVRTARDRRHSSTLWLERQLNDPYVAEAKRLGYRSRSAFKLQQMDERFGLLRKGAKVIDIGCAPGGWLQVAVAKVGARGRVVGLDLLPVEPLAGATILQGDFLADEAPENLKAALGGRADLVLSDMAANTVGHANTDSMRTLALAEAAIAFAEEMLAPKGAFVCKVLQGGLESGLLARLRKLFTSVRHVKPPASRADSAELYLVATGFRGEGA